MFRTNTNHLQRTFYGLWNQLSKGKQKKLCESKEAAFYELIFNKINENIFDVLYCDDNGRPNSPVNSLVASNILMHHKGWTCEELFSHIDFDLLTRTALGLDDLEETPFTPATFFNFQNRLHQHYTETGENLLETVFDTLTQEQLKELKIKMDIQRCDSFQAMSNIAQYSRLRLLIEMLRRVHRILSESDEKKYEECLSPYIKHSSGQYLYKVEHSEFQSEMEKIAFVYHKLHEGMKETYADVNIFQTFERVYSEHFTVVDEKINVKLKKELHSGCLQAPDDPEATFRCKKNRNFKGQVVNVVETANPENEVNLINDVAVSANNTDDGKNLGDRINKIVEKAPDLNEMHTDGAYGSEENDKKMEEHQINHVVTAVKGRTKSQEFNIEKRENDEYVVTCPNGKEVKSQDTKTGKKACFGLDICQTCPYGNECQATIQKNCRVFYFNESDYLLQQRRQKIKNLPPERQRIRPNVEATMKEFTRGFNHKGKLRYRGLFRTIVYAYATAMGINFGRIFRMAAKSYGFSMLMVKYCVNFVINISRRLKLAIKSNFLLIIEICRQN